MDVLNLLNMVFIIFLVALWWGLYDAAHSPPETEQDPFQSLAMSGLLVGGAPFMPAGTPSTGLDHVLTRIGAAAAASQPFPSFSRARGTPMS